MALGLEDGTETDSKPDQATQTSWFSWIITTQKLGQLSAWVVAGGASLILSLGMFSSCASKNGQGASLFGSSNEANEDFEDEEDEEDVDDEDEPGKRRAGAGLPHPKKPSAFYTRVFVLTQPQPPGDRITGCLEQLSMLASEASNQEALVMAQGQASVLVASDLALYHYCFYQMAWKLDERMDLGGPLMDELATAFFDGIKKLWILARALDSSTGSERYLGLLTARYIQISREYFGRHIEVLAPPLSNFENGTFQPSKSAGPAILP